ncbi:hypothetical protein BS78_01G257100 [Paspalum vaginatum]|nr:hypothetical protein BS78_01G257100 [Paspalum vaginatum]
MRWILLLHGAMQQPLQRRQLAPLLLASFPSPSACSPPPRLFFFPATTVQQPARYPLPPPQPWRHRLLPPLSSPSRPTHVLFHLLSHGGVKLDPTLALAAAHSPPPLAATRPQPIFLPRPHLQASAQHSIFRDKDEFKGLKQLNRGNLRGRDKEDASMASATTRCPGEEEEEVIIIVYE